MDAPANPSRRKWPWAASTIARSFSATMAALDVRFAAALMDASLPFIKDIQHSVNLQRSFPYLGKRTLLYACETFVSGQSHTGENMKIGIIGAGNIGSALAGYFHKLQHIVWIANSRGPETLSRVAQETGATPVDISEVAKEVDLLVIAIPMKSVLSLPNDLLASLPMASPIIDTGNYYPLRDGRITKMDKGMVESEWTSYMLGRPVIKAFNNIVADSLLHKGHPKGSKHRIA